MADHRHRLLGGTAGEGVAAEAVGAVVSRDFPTARKSLRRSGVSCGSRRPGIIPLRRSGGTGRRTGLKIPGRASGVWVRPPPPAAPRSGAEQSSNRSTENQARLVFAPVLCSKPRFRLQARLRSVVDLSVPVAYFPYDGPAGPARPSDNTHASPAPQLNQLCQGVSPCEVLWRGRARKPLQLLLPAFPQAVKPKPASTTDWRELGRAPIVCSAPPMTRNRPRGGRIHDQARGTRRFPEAGRQRLFCYGGPLPL